VRSRRLGERDLDREWERRRRRLKKESLPQQRFKFAHLEKFTLNFSILLPNHLCSSMNYFYLFGV